MDLKNPLTPSVPWGEVILGENLSQKHQSFLGQYVHRVLAADECHARVCLAFAYQVLATLPRPTVVAVEDRVQDVRRGAGEEHHPPA